MKTNFNQHSSDYRETGIEFNVKNPPGEWRIGEDAEDYEQQTGAFLLSRAHQLTAKLKKRFKWIQDWTFAGRSGGYFVLLTNKDAEDISPDTLAKLTEEVKYSYKTFVEDLNKYYGV
jgi:hypothetical protein